MVDSFAMVSRKGVYGCCPIKPDSVARRLSAMMMITFLRKGASLKCKEVSNG